MQLFFPWLINIAWHNKGGCGLLPVKEVL